MARRRNSRRPRRRRCRNLIARNRGPRAPRYGDCGSVAASIGSFVRSVRIDDGRELAAVAPDEAISERRPPRFRWDFLTPTRTISAPIGDRRVGRGETDNLGDAHTSGVRRSCASSDRLRMQQCEHLVVREHGRKRVVWTCIGYLVGDLRLAERGGEEKSNAADESIDRARLETTLKKMQSECSNVLGTELVGRRQTRRRIVSTATYCGSSCPRPHVGVAAASSASSRQAPICWLLE